MLIYILKFSACLFIFLAVYKIVLERESFHKLKRFYLLASLFISLCIPFITFTEYVEIAPIVGTYSSGTSEVVYQDIVIETSWKDYLPTILWTLYIIGLIIFSIRFAKHLYQMYFRIKNNLKLKDTKFTNVLLIDKINPHTFFKYIFLNKHKFESNAIPKEVLLHEQTHAKQLHALDILVIEILQIVFWFNPLLYLIKKDIKLNHEFLADQSVLKEGIEPINYQQLLLAFSSNASEPQLANAINYSSIKKRLTVMKTHTSKTRTWAKSIILLPLLAILVYGFSSEKVEYLHPKTNEANATDNYFESSKPKKELLIMVQVNSIIINGKPSTLKTFKDDLNFATKDWEETDYTSVIPNVLIASTTKDYLQKLELEFSKTHISKANEGFTLNQFKAFMKEASGNNGATHKELSIYNALAKKHNKYPEVSRQILLKDLQQLERIYKRMTASQKKVAQPFPNCPPTSELTQDGATKAQIVEYNKLAKKYNAMSSNDMTIYMSDVKRLEYLYKTMSKKQRKNAEPFPNFPEPPKAPEVLEVLEQIPPPPPPKAPLDHLIEMAKNNAIFYLEGKKISSDKAIEVLKRNKSLNIETKGSNSKQPKVYITKAPVIIEKIKASPKTGFITVKGKKLYYTNINNEVTYYNRYGVITDEKGNELHPNQQVHSNNVLPNTTISKIYSNNKVVSEFKKDNSEMQSPPPEVPSMLELANKNAIFYYEEQKISSRKAIELIDNNNALNILIRGVDSKNPIVKISRKPIVVENKRTMQKTGSINLETGTTKINGEAHFYATKDGTTTYFNHLGEQVDKQGKRITNSSEKNPAFYYNGNIISANQANHLLKTNKNIAVTSENFEDGKYNVTLSNINTKNKNVNRNLIGNLNNNPNSAIDLTQAINNGAKFYLDDKEISSQEAKEVVNTNETIRIQTINNKNSYPVVLISKKSKN